MILFNDHVDLPLASQAISMGANDVLRKPVNPEEFVTVLTLALNTYGLTREVRIRRVKRERLAKRMET